MNDVQAHPTPAANRPELNVGFVLLPDFTLMALTGFIEALRIAADDRDHSQQIYCSWTIMAPNLAPVRSSSGVSVLPFETFRNPEEFDYIVVVGGLLDSQKKIDARITAYVRQAAAGRPWLVGACTGSFYLARVGLMEGRRCCIHQFHLAEFQAEFPTIYAEADDLFKIDGRRITCPGGGSVVDLAIHLVERHCGRDRAQKVVCQFIYEDARKHNHPQARLAFEDLPSFQDPTVHRAVLLMQQHIGNSIKIAHIAKHLNTSTRRMERLFQSEVGMTPTDFYRLLRLERVRWLLEHTSKQVAAIAHECGFSDTPHLSRTWRQHFGSTPSEHREKHHCHEKPSFLANARNLSPHLFPSRVDH